MSEFIFSTYAVRVRAVEAVQRGLPKSHVAFAYGIDRVTLYRWLELKSHQAKTKEELRTLTLSKLEAMSNNARLLRGIYFRCCVADFLG